MNRRYQRLLTICCLATIIIATSIAWSGQPNQVRTFMRSKLNHSQQVLEGLSTEDYDTIAKHAQDLSLLSLASNWQVLQTEEYVQQSREFRRAADALRDAAKKKNLDGAALAYVDMTMKCINCHKYVRSTRVALAR